ncbi:MAG: DUF4178 domain-containing protein [Phycisphaerae bacterium]|nr:DUF4178 domain-containing protein [Gemmatimonadaceae bacterium]
MLDAQDPNLRILQQAKQQRSLVQPRIPLGSRGTWKGVQWEVVGFQQVTITVDEVPYSWKEYVCFNPFHGFFYLTEYEGHWNVVEKLRRRPDDKQADSSKLKFNGLEFKHFQSASAVTTFALGEFPWEVNVGDQVRSHDFVSPPYLLSAEVTEHETTWSLGTYTDSNAIARAFALTSPTSSPVGVLANQPNPHVKSARAIRRTCSYLMLALLVMLIGNVVMSKGAVVFDKQFQFDRAQGDTTALVTESFDMGGRVSNVAFFIQTDLENDWAFFNLALIDEVTGQAIDVGRQVSYYNGRDTDGSWSEGSRHDNFKLGAIPPGKYFLRIAPEGGEVNGRVVNYGVRIRRDVPSYTFYVLAFFALLVPALISWAPSASFEQRRWAESDHAPVSATDDDSSDDE